MSWCAAATCGSTTFDADAATTCSRRWRRKRARWSSRGAAGAPVRERRAAFMRYVGQGHEITVELPNRRLTAADSPSSAPKFERGLRGAVRAAIPGAAIEV